MNLAAASFPQVPGRWVKLVLLLCGDIERNPGPWSPPAKGGIIVHHVVLSTILSGFQLPPTRVWTSVFMVFRCGYLNIWKPTSRRFQLIALALALRSYGRFIYENGYPRYLLCRNGRADILVPWERPYPAQRIGCNAPLPGHRRQQSCDENWYQLESKETIFGADLQQVLPNFEWLLSFPRHDHLEEPCVVPVCQDQFHDFGVVIRFHSQRPLSWLLPWLPHRPLSL